MYPRLLVGAMLLLITTITSHAQISFDQNQIQITLVPGADHLDIVAPVTLGSDVDVANLQVSSDADWVGASYDNAGGILLEFATAALTNSSNTATVSVTDGLISNDFYLQASLAPLNIVRLLDDPQRPYVYALHTNGVERGALLIYNQLDGSYFGSLTLGMQPTDLDISPDGSELFVINNISEKIDVIDLASFTHTETINLPDFVAYTHPSYTQMHAHVAAGPEGIIYYVDSAWGPTLYVYDRDAGQVIQTMDIDGSSTASGSGFGDLAVSPDKTLLFGWAQVGWGAGWAGSYLSSFTIGSDGTLSHVDKTSSNYPTDLRRDPFETPVLISSDGLNVFVKEWMVHAGDIQQVRQTFSSPVYAISHGGEIVSTNSEIVEVATGNTLYSLPVNSAVQTITADYTKLVYFDDAANTLESIDLLQEIGSTILGRTLEPADGSIVLPPDELDWEPVPGAVGYNVYLSGSDDLEVSDPAAFIGEVSIPSHPVTDPLAAGTTYYWRVDVITQNGIVAGTVRSFIVSSVASSVSEIVANTLAGFSGYEFDFDLSSETDVNRDYELSADVSWIEFPKPSGSTPDSVTVRLNAGLLSQGIHTADITVSDGTVTLFTLPVRLRVDAIHPRHMKERAGTPFVYVVSEDDSRATGTAYLFEVNTVTEEISRMVEVGSSVTDLAVHEADNRIYVPNWRTGALLAVNLDTFEIERTYAFSPFGGTGYGDGDVYRVAAGAAGRVLIEPEDQWIEMSIYDTVNGVTLAEQHAREGGGDYDPTGRYYYHGGNNSSGEGITKYEVTGDQFNQLAFIRVTTVSYYGSRVVVVSQDGERVFWNGASFDKDLNLLWEIGEIIHSSSPTGRFAFSGTAIYDTERQRKVADMPTETSVSAFNGLTEKLIYDDNGSIGYLNLDDPNDAITPANGSIVAEVPELSWDPVASATAYQVYLGTSDVSNATESDSTYLGEVSTTSISLSPLSNGNYYWRVDTVTPWGVIPGEVHQFTSSSISVDQTEITVNTVDHFDRYQTDIILDAPLSENWALSSPVEWIDFSADSGTTPATITITIDARAAGVGTHNTTIQLESDAQPLSAIPVELTVDPLNITVLNSDPESNQAYAISTDSPTDGRAYLLEIDTDLEVITRVVPAGNSATDLAIHNPDNAIYVTNWRGGKIKRFNRTTLLQEDFLEFQSGGSGYTDKDPYVIAAGAAGRLMVEAEDQWIDMFVIDTSTGSVLATADVREGGGVYDSTGRYYYHGGNNSSGEGLTKYDVLGDVINQLAFKRVTSVSYYGSRIVAISEDDSRIFWNGAVFDDQLNVLWEIGEIIHSTTDDGKYAISGESIYDVDEQVLAFGLPFNSTVSAYNSTTRKLLLSDTNGIHFIDLSAPITLMVPTLSVAGFNPQSVTLNWTNPDLETGFTLQYRQVGTTNWTDAPAPEKDVTSATISGLTAGASYEVRIKADATLQSSSWSNIEGFTMPIPVPVTPSIQIDFFTAREVDLSWSDINHESQYILERAINGGEWSPLATLPANTVAYTDSTVSTGSSYNYRIAATNSSGQSSWSQTSVIIAEDRIVILQDDFSANGVDPSKWSDSSGGNVINSYMHFGLGMDRQITSHALDLTTAEDIRFRLHAGNNSTFENSDPEESVVLEYQTGGSWIWNQISLYDTIYPNYSEWTEMTALLPEAAKTPSTKIRLRQLSHSGSDYDEWGIDDILILAQSVDVRPEISLFYDGVNLQNGDDTPSSIDGTDFGNVSCASGSVTRTFRVRNTGNATLVLGEGTSSNTQFEVNGLASRIPAGSFDDFTVVFDPSDCGLATATISFWTNVNDADTFNFTVSGEGIDEVSSWYSSAMEMENGWRYFDWFKAFKPVGENWIFHARHGWLYSHADDTNRLFLWDDRLGRWMFTNESVYPWMYAFGADGGWVFFFEGGSPGARFFARGNNGAVVSEEELSSGRQPSEN